MIPAHIEERILRLHFVEKWPVGTIAKQVGVHHSTVKRVLHSQGVSVELTARPSMVESFLPFIRETLEAYPELPSSRLHEMVAERGYPGSRSHFRRLVATLRPRKPAEAFQRLSTLPGEEAQVDWASFGSRVVGKATRRVSAFVMVLSWSRMPFVRFFYDCPSEGWFGSDALGRPQVAVNARAAPRALTSSRRYDQRPTGPRGPLALGVREGAAVGSGVVGLSRARGARRHSVAAGGGFAQANVFAPLPNERLPLPNRPFGPGSRSSHRSGTKR